MELLEWVKNTVKVGKITTKKNYNEETHKNSYTYTIIYDEAIQLLQDIEPYLVIEKKKARAQHIISKYKEVTIRNGRYNKSQRLAKEQFYIDFIAL